MTKRFHRKAAAVFCLTVLLISLLTACAAGAPQAEAVRLLGSGYYEFYDGEEELLYFCQVKESKMIFVDPDGSEKKEYRLRYEEEDERYTIKKDDTSKSFTVTENKNGLRLRTADGETFYLQKVGKDSFPEIALASEVDDWSRNKAAETGLPNGPATDAPADLKETLRLATGGASGNYYSFGTAIAQHAAGIGIDLIVSASDGSQDNISKLVAGEAELGFCQTDVLFDAYTGFDLYREKEKVTGFSVVGALYKGCVQLVAVDPDIKTVADLKGKRVSVGGLGSGTYFNALDILAVYGMSLTDVVPVYQSFDESSNDLQSGKIDAAFIVFGIPTAVVGYLFNTNEDAHLISFDEDHLNRLLKAHPAYSRSVIPGGTYGGQSESVVTPAVSAVLIVRDDVSEETVYYLTKDIFDNAPYLTSAHTKYGEISVGSGASLTAFPYHPGAARYFRERGYTVSTDASGLK